MSEWCVRYSTVFRALGYQYRAKACGLEDRVPPEHTTPQGRRREEDPGRSCLHMFSSPLPAMSIDAGRWLWQS